MRALVPFVVVLSLACGGMAGDSATEWTAPVVVVPPPPPPEAVDLAVEVTDGAGTVKVRSTADSSAGTVHVSDGMGNTVTMSASGATTTTSTGTTSVRTSGSSTTVTTSGSFDDDEDLLSDDAGPMTRGGSATVTVEDAGEALEDLDDLDEDPLIKPNIQVGPGGVKLDVKLGKKR